jgi:dTDP-4-amino-4,6-dideoxygalactose transaminase
MSTPFDIPFNRPWSSGREVDYVRESATSWHTAGNGPFTKRCEALLEQMLTAPRALLTTSCTDALEMCALLLRVQPGDEVIVPSYTFVSTANAFSIFGARPVFCDVRPDTFNLDESALENLVNERTRAIVVVHYGGVACDMDAILAIGQRHGVPVIEDNAHGLLGTYRGRKLGRMGALATQSFHETKNIHCGEGGALIVNDAELSERAEIVREKGTNRSRFLRGEIDKYTWVDVGSSYLPSDLTAAFLCAQLEARDDIQARRAAVWKRYADGLSSWMQQHGVRTQHVPEECTQAYHLFCLVLPDLETRTRLIAHLRERRIQAVFHYVPLHLAEMGRRFGGRDGLCPVTERVAATLVRLPFHTGLAADEQDRVIEAVRDLVV